MSEPYFLSICLNPTLQKTLVFSRLVRDEVNRSREYCLDASGKGINVTRVLSQLGERAVHLTHSGGVNRSLFLSLAEKDGLDVRSPDSKSEVRTCITLIDKSDRSVTELVEEAAPVSPGTEKAVLEAYRSLLEGAHTVVISGTKADGYSDGLFPAMVAEAKRKGTFVILDYRGKDLLASLPEGPDVVKPNFDEFIATYFPEASSGERESPAFLDRVKGKMAELHREYGVKSVLTRGKREAIAFDGEEFSIHPTEAIATVNSIGSGDAFTAGLAAKLHTGSSFAEAVAEGQRCGRLNASLLRPGVIR
jgi:fructose-1-phosphate kinase PfkB-like protein